MKILMFGWEFPPHNSGGLGTACHGLTKYLSKRGIEIIFVLPKKVNVDADFIKFVFGGKERKYVVNSLLSVYSTNEEYSSRLFCHAEQKSENFHLYGQNLNEEVERYGEIAKEIAQQEEFDLIHAHDWLTFKAGIAAKKVSRKPLIVHVHATEFDRTGGNLLNQDVYNMEKEGMEEADLIITVSDFTKNKIIEHYNMKPQKVRVVHNSVEFENYALEKASVLKKNNKIVLFLGRITLQKGPDYFIYSARKVVNYMPNVIFLVGGSGDMEKFLIRKAAELGIGDKVLFMGFVRGKEKSKAYQMADVYVMPSVSEPFGITPLESLVNKTPVIISKQSGVSEILKNCLKVDFWDVDELSNKIISVLKYPELQQCLKENGHAEVCKMSWDSAAEKCHNIYKEVLKL